MCVLVLFFFHQCNSGCDGEIAGVSNAYSNMRDTELFGDFFYLSGEGNFRLTKLVVYYFNVCPGDFPPPAGTYEF